MNRLVMTVATAGFMAWATVASAQSSAAAGEKVYTAQKCQICHSIAGKGNQKGPLDGVGTKLKADEIRQWIVDPATMTAKTKSTRKPPMKAYANLSKEDVDALVTYLATLKKS